VGKALIFARKKDFQKRLYKKLNKNSMLCDEFGFLRGIVSRVSCFFNT
jgi:hypothetical protein